MSEQSKKNAENTTECGEFVCSLEHWILPEEQREKAKKLENISKNKRKQKKK